MTVLFFVTLPLVLLLACTQNSGGPQGNPVQGDISGPLMSILPAAEKRIGDSSQVLLVVNSGSRPFSAKVYALEKRDGQWRNAMPALNAVIGRNGFAPPGEKREGDGRTPTGVFSLGTSFGYEPALATNMPYRQAGADDLWVDDPGAQDYNRWVKRGETKAVSFESLRRKDDLYKYGIVIEYNSKPVVKGRGSAIFIHIWKGPGEPTLGCVAVAEKDVLGILRWLDPSAKPLVVMGTEETIIEGFPPKADLRQGSRGQGNPGPLPTN